MALNWDMTGCDFNPAELHADQAEWHKSESLIFQTMAIGMRTITEQNAEQFWTRVYMFALACGTKPYTSIDDVRKRIGLQTNATPMTDAAFHKHLISVMRKDARRLAAGLPVY